MIKVGIIGCGKIADQHAEEIRKIPSCRLVGVCDTEELMARQLYERFDAEHYFSDTGKLLDAVGPGGVVHITTPPQSHYGLGMQSLGAGCNVYMEKPFTVTAGEARRLLAMAQKKNLKITAGHNAQFSHAARAMRKLVAGGYLGGMPVHLEGHYCYSFGDRAYAQAVLGDRGHWVRKLPGGLLQNIICHGISKIAEFLPGDSPLVLAHGYTSKFLESLNERSITDELRVIIHDEEGPSAYFTFSSQISPVLHQLRVYGPRNGLIVDDDHQSLIKIQGRPYKSYLNQFLPPLSFARQYAANALRNAAKFLGNDFHMNGGMGFLVNSLYRSVLHDTPPPIAYREILLTYHILDSIFDQLAQSRLCSRKAS